MSQKKRVKAAVLLVKESLQHKKNRGSPALYHWGGVTKRPVLESTQPEKELVGHVRAISMKGVGPKSIKAKVALWRKVGINRGGGAKKNRGLGTSFKRTGDVLLICAYDI